MHRRQTYRTVIARDPLLKRIDQLLLLEILVPLGQHKLREEDSGAILDLKVLQADHQEDFEDEQEADFGGGLQVEDVALDAS